MDRSFLSREEVIAASRQLVCVRLATYEDSDEAALLKNLVRSGSGELENTVFCLLAPDGRTKLARSARGIGQVFATPTAFAAALSQAAGRFPAKADGGPAPLPDVKTVALALNVAAADNLPLVVLIAGEGDARKETEQALAKLAWSPEFIGRFVYATAKSADDLRTISGDKANAAFLVVQPEKFGRSGTVLARGLVGAKPEAIATTLREGASRFKDDEKNFATHVREGHRKRVFWETPVPVTDPHELDARERGRQ
jgi:hypothetical protein